MIPATMPMSSPSQVVDLVLAKISVLVAEWGLRIVFAILVIVVGLILTRLTQRWVIRVLERSHAEQAAVLSAAFGRIVLLTGLVLTIAVALVALGVDLGAMVAGLGLTSVALGFALKDTIEQAITGMLLLLQQPFHVGDVVEIDDEEGTVTEVGIRTTALRTIDGIHVLIPNNTVYQSVIRNKSRYPARCHALAFGLAPATDLSDAYRLLMSAIRDAPGVLAEPAPDVTFEGFSDSGIRAVLRYWVPSSQSKLPAQSELTRALAAAAAEAGLDMSPPAVMLLGGGAPEPALDERPPA
jgi:small-conductance mechanosensitive channel